MISDSWPQNQVEAEAIPQGEGREEEQVWGGSWAQPGAWWV